MVTHLEPVPTRWGSWLNAALYYAKNLLQVKAVVKSFVGSEISETQAKVSLQKSGLAGQLLKIKDHYECLVKLIKKIESAKYTIKEAVQASKNLTLVKILVTSTNRLKKNAKQ